VRVLPHLKAGAGVGALCLWSQGVGEGRFGVLSFTLGYPCRQDNGTVKRRGCQDDAVGIVVSERGDGVGRFSASPWAMVVVVEWARSAMVVKRQWGLVVCFARAVVVAEGDGGYGYRLRSCVIAVVVVVLASKAGVLVLVIMPSSRVVVVWSMLMSFHRRRSAITGRPSSFYAAGAV